MAIAFTKNCLSIAESTCEPRVMLAAGSNINEGYFKEHNFDDNTIGPFTPGSTDTHDEFTEYTDGTMIVRFDQEEYDENPLRSWRGAEIKGATNFEVQGYAGFNLTIPEDFPEDRETIVHQWFNWTSAAGSNSAWTQVLTLIDDDLYLTRRSGQVQARDIYLIAEDLPKGEMMEFKLRLQAGNATIGRSRVVLNDTLIADIENARFGWGDFYTYEEDGTLGTGVVGTKMGMYAIDTQVGEDPELSDRSLIYDNISSVGDHPTWGGGQAMNRIDPDEDSSPEDWDYQPEFIQELIEEE